MHWELERAGVGTVSTHSIRYRILKVVIVSEAVASRTSFNPFDPIQDTESAVLCGEAIHGYQVSTHSIRYRILKVGCDVS